MATFSDIIDRLNLRSVLVVGLEVKMTTGGSGGTFYLAERYMILPKLGGGEIQVAGSVLNWGEFGYVADLEGFQGPGSDARITVSHLPLHAWAQPLHYLLQFYELVGGAVTIYQYVEDRSGWLGRQIYTGRVRDAGQISDGSFEIEVTDITRTVGEAPETEVNRADFPDCPDGSMGVPIPIVYGDFSALPDPSGPIDADHMFILGMIKTPALPTVQVDRLTDDSSYQGLFRVAAHQCHTVNQYAGLVIQEPELQLPCLCDYYQWICVNSAGRCDAKPKWPFTARAPVVPNGAASSNGASNPDHCWDADETTTVSLGASTILQVTLENLPELGTITLYSVVIWIAAGLTGAVKIGLHDGSSWVGDGTGNTMITSSTEGTYTHTVVVSGNPLTVWDSGSQGYEIRVESLAGSSCTVKEARVSVIYHPNRKVAPKSDWTEGGALWGHTGKKGGPRYEQPGRKGSMSDKPRFHMFVKGAKDDGSGTYTGSANSLIENAADIAHHLLVEHSGLTSSQIAGSSDIGSFTAARTELGTYHKLAMWIGERTPVWDLFNRICLQARAVPIYNSEGELGMVVMDPTPTANYRGVSDVFYFQEDKHFYRSSFVCGRTSLDRCTSRVYVDFDWSVVDQEFRKSTWVTPDGSDNGIGTQDQASHREIYAGYGETRFGRGRDFRIRAYDLRKQGVAKVLRNWVFDTHWRPRVWAQFEAGRHVCDLSIGNVIKFADNAINGLAVPGPDLSGSKYWSAFEWYVQSVIRMDGPGEVPRYRVRVVEAVEPTYSTDWVAAADDT